jgi:predicted MFS family arabinose efflux permease
VSLRDRVKAIGIKGVPTTLITIIIGICGIFVLYTYLAWFVGRVGGLTGAGISLIYLIFGVTAVVCSFSAGWLIDHVAPARVAALSLAGVFVVQAAFAVTAWAANGYGSAAAAYALGFLVALWGLTSWLFNPAQQKRLIAAAGPRRPCTPGRPSRAWWAACC